VVRVIWSGQGGWVAESVVVAESLVIIHSSTFFLWSPLFCISEIWDFFFFFFNLLTSICIPPPVFLKFLPLSSFSCDLVCVVEFCYFLIRSLMRFRIFHVNLIS
jgi:hypothetical protein